tara:strand:+ start:726 stop:1118 length:393 start_codon:yes stop_codon:yes gene_type:complete
MNQNEEPEAAHSAVHQDNIDISAERFYSTYCKEVGGVAFNGDPLPTWDEFSKDESKTKQSDAWKAVATDAIEMVSWQINSAIERKAEILTFNIDGKDTPRMVFFLDGGDKNGPPLMNSAPAEEPSLIVVE